MGCRMGTDWCNGVIITIPSWVTTYNTPLGPDPLALYACEAPQMGGGLSRIYKEA